MKVVLKVILYLLLITVAGWSVKQVVRIYQEQSERAAHRFEGIVPTEWEEHGTKTNQSIPSPSSLTFHSNQTQTVQTTNSVPSRSTTAESTNRLSPNPSSAEAVSPTASQGITNQTAAVSTNLSSPPSQPSHRFGLGTYGFIAVLSILALALLVAHDVSQYFSQRFHTLILEGSDQAATDETYEEAEKAWARGEYLEAIRLLREYLQKHPRRIYAKFRIAEIYEKDLNNPLAAALEYEEILQYKFDPDHWGWAAIHLCNLYNRTGQTEKAVELLRKIVREYGQTPAAEKARKRLQMLGEKFGPQEASTEEEESPTGLKLPRGFRPKK